MLLSMPASGHICSIVAENIVKLRDDTGFDLRSTGHH